MTVGFSLKPIGAMRQFVHEIQAFLLELAQNDSVLRPSLVGELRLRAESAVPALRVLQVSGRVVLYN